MLPKREANGASPDEAPKQNPKDPPLEKNEGEQSVEKKGQVKNREQSVQDYDDCSYRDMIFMLD